jgi:hypothetical protein
MSGVPQDFQKLGFFGVGGLEEVGPLQDLDAARPAGGAPAGERNRSHRLVTNVDQRSTFGDFGDRVLAKDVSLEMDRGHLKAPGFLPHFSGAGPAGRRSGGPGKVPANEDVLPPGGPVEGAPARRVKVWTHL